MAWSRPKAGFWYIPLRRKPGEGPDGAAGADGREELPAGLRDNADASRTRKNTSEELGHDSLRDLASSHELAGRGRPPHTLSGARRQRLRAVRTALRVNWNLAETFAALLGRRIGWRRSFAGSGDQSVYGSHYEEIDCRDQQKRNQGIHEIAHRKSCGSDGETEGGEIRFADYRCDERGNEVFQRR